MQAELDVHVFRSFASLVDEAWLRSVAEEVLATQKVEGPVALSLVVADETTVQKLNRTYREEDEVTDVLAFSFREGSQPFVPPPDGLSHLGEVILAYPQAVRQAQEAGVPVPQEVAHLVVHGILHLLGYDHQNSDEEKRMRAAEAQILEKVRCVP